MYRKIEANLWNDVEVLKLSMEGQHLFIYLITNPLAHVSGLYYLPESMIAAQAKLREGDMASLWTQLSEANLAHRDDAHGLVWVVNMLKYQGKGGKIRQAVQAHIAKLQKSSPLLARFCEHYQGWCVAPEGEQSKPTPKQPTVLADADFIATLKKNPAYTHINIDVELGKMDAWLLTSKGKGRTKTRAFVVNWLNRVERPLPSAPAPRKGLPL